MDYKNTLNLPKTNFPMKANLPQRELEFLARWGKMDLYNLLRQQSKNHHRFILHDGPPYANGYLHLGTALNKILKDIIIKSRQMTGFNAIYIPGWDCHGLPIEHEVDKELGAQKFKIDILSKRKKCRSYAENFITIQRNDFIRLGVFGDWYNPYLTMRYSYEAAIVQEFAKFYHNGSVYRSKKPIYWCNTCQTALAEAEVEYIDRESLSIYVAFLLCDNLALKYPNQYSMLKNLNVYLVIWTTTPWTIPANIAITAHPEFEYAAYKVDNKAYILASHLAPFCLKAFGFNKWEQIAYINAKHIEGIRSKHPLYDRVSVGTLSKHVTLDMGTGLVHTAPGHGREDYEVALKYGLNIYSPLDNQARFTKEVEFFAGQNVFDANPKIVAKLKEIGAILATDKIKHSYPHCWRCKNPLIFRATEQWFISMETNKLRKKSLEAIIQKVRWIPKWSRNRIYNMIENRLDWCISRQRSWGVPIIIFECISCGKMILTPDMAKKIIKAIEKNGSDIWFSKTSMELLGELSICPFCGGTKLKKGEDILDVWFDSGVSYIAISENTKHWPNLRWPADLYLEGSDQHRGWFHSSLLCAVGTKGEPPYKMVLTHGFVVDGEGYKMSKSLGNVIPPQQVIEQYGAEILRLWVAAEDYTNDIRISENILKQLTEGYRRIRNTMRFILGNLYDFDPNKNNVSPEKMNELDRLILHRLEDLKSRLKKAYEEFSFHIIQQGLHNFCAVDLSSFYLNIIKDRLYTSPAKSLTRQAAQSVLYRLGLDLVRLMAPILSFTAEEIWDHLPGAKDMHASVHLANLPEANHKLNDLALAERWECLIAVRTEVNKALEIARKDKIIGNSLEAQLAIAANPELKIFLEANINNLIEITMVSEIILTDIDKPTPSINSKNISNMKISINQVNYLRCSRCWMHLSSVGINSEYPDLCHRCLKVEEIVNKIS